MDPRYRKVLRRFYEPVLLLNALGETRGAQTKPDFTTDGISPNIQKLRRSFVDGIAYICTYEKNPPSVTAVALERKPEGVTVWLAANTDISDHVIRFLEGILAKIQRIADVDGRERRQREGEGILEDLIYRIIAFNVPRLRCYYTKIQHHMPGCIEIINNAHGSSGR